MSIERAVAALETIAGELTKLREMYEIETERCVQREAELDASYEEDKAQTEKLQTVAKAEQEALIAQLRRELTAAVESLFGQRTESEPKPVRQ